MCHTLSEVTQTRNVSVSRLSASPSLQTRQCWLGMSCTNILQTSGFCLTGPGHTDDWSLANTHISPLIGLNVINPGL